MGEWNWRNDVHCPELMIRASVAVIGAGPAGLYVAQQLRRALPDAALSVLDRMPVPFGLVRYGVATDHQSTKGVTAQFERLFERERVRFFGNIEVGRDVAFDELRDLFDAVVIATGLSADRQLGIVGEDGPAVFRAGAVTRWFNSHPCEGEACPSFGPNVVVVGNGNVALDIARLLARGPGEFGGTDIDPDRLGALARSGPRTIDVVGRRRSHKARFDPALLAEFGRLGAARVEVHSLADTPDTDRVSAALRAVHGNGPEASLHTVRFRFGLTPIAIEAGAVTFADTAGAAQRLPASSVVTAAGFAWDAAGDVGERAIRAEPGLYRAGWYRSGGRGTIADARAEGRAVAQEVAADLAAQEARRMDGADELAGLLSLRGVPVVDHAGWRRIDAVERQRTVPGFVRRKLIRLDAMLACAFHEGPMQVTQ